MTFTESIFVLGILFCGMSFLFGLAALVQMLVERRNAKR